MRLIDADALLEKVREIRKLALDRAAETPDYITYPIFQNPAYTRYSTQADEREKFKVMIEEEPTVQLSTNLAEVGTNLVSKQAEQRWIPVTERLPEDDTRVQVTFANGIVGQSSWHKENEYNNGFDAVMHGVTDRHFVTFGVIAWMELPEPYQGGEQK